MHVCIVYMYYWHSRLCCRLIVKILYVFHDILTRKYIIAKCVDYYLNVAVY